MTATVLIVDDSSLARRMLRQHLEALNFTVIEAADGTEALESFFLHRPDLVILDMVMTGMYGTEVLAKLIELQPDVRVIIATADIQTSTAEQVRAAGAKAILNKPIVRQQLADAVAMVMEGSSTWN